MNDKTLEEAHVILHPIRFRIAELLIEKPMHINEIAKTLGEERRLVTYHLQTLEDFGFVGSKYEISEAPKSRGKAIRKYWATDKVSKTLEHIKGKL